LDALASEQLDCLAWPLLPQPTPEESESFLAYVLTLEPTPELLFEVVMALLAGVVWHADGGPARAAVRAWSDRLIAALRA
jgi:hypothetical protein